MTRKQAIFLHYSVPAFHAIFYMLHVFYLTNLNETRMIPDCNINPQNCLGGMHENKSIRSRLHLTY